MTKLVPVPQDGIFCEKLLGLLQKKDIETAEKLLEEQIRKEKEKPAVPKAYHKPKRNAAMEGFSDITKKATPNSHIFLNPARCMFAGRPYFAFTSGPMVVFSDLGLPDHMPFADSNVPEWALEASLTEILPDRIDMAQTMQEAKDRGYTGLRTEARKCHFYVGPQLSENRQPFLLFYKRQYYAIPWLELAYAILDDGYPMRIGQMTSLQKGKPKPVILRNPNGAALIMPFHTEHPENAASRIIRLEKQNNKK